jgi:putative heme iron utilization protein
MKFVVLKAFPYAHDHHVTVVQDAGAVVEIDDSVAEGLIDEGYIREATDEEIDGATEGPVVVAPPVEIPAGWAKLPWFNLQRLATALNGGGKVANKVAAVAIVEAELASRADA